MWVLGEWSKCRHHNRVKTYAYGHKVDPEVRRWQTIDRSGKVSPGATRGVGVFSFRPTTSLLYKNGYAKPLGDVLGDLPEYWRSTIKAARSLKFSNRSTSSDDFRGGQSDPIRKSRSDVAQGLPIVVEASRFAAIIFLAALVLTVVSIPMSGYVNMAFQYAATLGFALAWAATRSGIYHRDPAWFIGACRKSLQWWFGIFVPVAVLNLFFTFVN